MARVGWWGIIGSGGRHSTGCINVVLPVSVLQINLFVGSFNIFSYASDYMSNNRIIVNAALDIT
jgi:hypothetical protein